MRLATCALICIFSTAMCSEKDVEKATDISFRYSKAKEKLTKAISDLKDLMGDCSDLTGDSGPQGGWLPLKAALTPRNNHSDFSYSFVGGDAKSAVFMFKKSFDFPNGRSVKLDPVFFCINDFKHELPKVGSDLPAIFGRLKPNGETKYKGETIKSYDLIQDKNYKQICDGILLVANSVSAVGNVRAEGVALIHSTMKSKLPKSEKESILSSLDNLDLGDKFDDLVKMYKRDDSSLTADDLGIKLPEIDRSSPSVPENDPKDPRPSIVRQHSLAMKYAEEYRDKAFAKSISPEKFKLYSGSHDQWKQKADQILGRIKAQKEQLGKEAKANLVKKAEAMFPVPPGSTLAARAKIESKQTAWVNENLKPALDQIARDYAAE